MTASWLLTFAIIAFSIMRAPRRRHAYKPDALRSNDPPTPFTWSGFIFGILLAAAGLLILLRLH
jgi:hypothetical protein